MDRWGPGGGWGTGNCEEIDLRNSPADPECIPTFQSSLMRLLKEKFLDADFAEIANLHFFTASRWDVP